MQTRQLGRTGHHSTVVIFGGAALWNETQETANQVLDLSLEHGINHIDVAPQYGLAEELVGRWLPPHRKKFFLGCKTMERGRDEAWAQLNESLEKLHTDQFDLHQLHSVGTMEDLELALGKGGAIETLQRAKDEGLTRFLGITGHGIDTPNVHLAALERFDFDTVMFPIHPRLYADVDYRRSAEKLLDVCQSRDVGVMIIKAITKGPWADPDHKAYKTWYEPYDLQSKIDEGVRFALSLPGVAAIPAAGDTRLLPMVIDAAERYTPMAAAERDHAIQDSAALPSLF